MICTLRAVTDTATRGLRTNRNPPSNHQQANAPAATLDGRLSEGVPDAAAHPQRALCCGAGDENRTRTISLGIGQVGVGMPRDLLGCLAPSDRDGPLSPGTNCTLIAR